MRLNSLGTAAQGLRLLQWPAKRRAGQLRAAAMGQSFIVRVQRLSSTVRLHNSRAGDDEHDGRCELGNATAIESQAA